MRCRALQFVNMAQVPCSASDSIQTIDMFCCACSIKHKLAAPRCADLVVVHLIDQENLMAAWSDHHPDPNIDIATVRFYGHRVDLPHETEWAGAPSDLWHRPSSVQPRQMWTWPAP